MKYFTGVGSRETPQDIQDIMEEFAFKLSQDCWVMRSGGAEGADSAFQAGASNTFATFEPEIYMPWYGFNNLYTEPGLLFPTKWKNIQEAYEIASKIHPNWDACSDGAKTLHSRNIYQVLGHNLATPSKFLICWAKTDKNGDATGGTRTTWMLAKQYNIPCFNLIFEEHKRRVMKFIGETRGN